MRNIRVFMLAGVLMAGSIAAVASKIMNALSSTTAAPPNYAASVYSETQWLGLSRGWIELYGMTETDSEEWALMSFGSYVTLTEGVDNGVIPLDTPIFIFEAFGTVPTLRGFGSASGSTDIGGFTLIFNGLTGDIMASSAYPQENLNTQGYGLDLSSIPMAHVRPQTPIAIPTIIFMASPVPEVTAEVTLDIIE